MTTPGLSPSERYAAFKRRAAEERSAFGAFRALYEFGLDGLYLGGLCVGSSFTEQQLSGKLPHRPPRLAQPP